MLANTRYMFRTMSAIEFNNFYVKTTRKANVAIIGNVTHMMLNFIKIFTKFKWAHKFILVFTYISQLQVNF